MSTSKCLGNFCGAPLNRASQKEHKDPAWETASLQHPGTRFLIFHVKGSSTDAAPVLFKDELTSPVIAWQSGSVLTKLGVEIENHRCNGVPPVRLGCTGDVQHFAILLDVGQEKLAECCEIREGSTICVSTIVELLLSDRPSEDDLTILGQAYAKLAWHKGALYCGVTGHTTEAYECGCKRQCPTSKVRMYPRTNPVAVALVRSPCNTKTLLYRGKDLPPGVWTCIDGCVDVGEQAEEAVHREVKDQSGVILDLQQGVKWLGSQPWPLGKGGSCQLMLGMEVQAVSEDINPNCEEIAEAKWFSLEEIRSMLSISWSSESAIESGKPFVQCKSFIAHRLLQRWVATAEDPIVSKVPPGLGGFCGSPLDRSATRLRKDPEAEKSLLHDPATLFLLFSTTKGSTGAAPVLLKKKPHPPAIAWQSCSTIQQIGLDLENYCCNGVPPILLGCKDGVQHFALLVGLSEEELSKTCYVPQGSSLYVSDGIGKILMIPPSAADMTILGHAYAKISWHKRALYCGATGEPTKPYECGCKRRSPDAVTSEYRTLCPRTDPICIALVSSPCRQKCLLCRSKDYPPGMWSCVSGFIDVGEQAEEAVCREVLEETGVLVDLAQGVNWLGTQPWPLGRGGNCELMLAMEVQSCSEELVVNREEIEDAKWFHRDQVREMLSIPWSREGKPFVPGKVAIAHHLLQRWVTS